MLLKQWTRIWLSLALAAGSLGLATVAYAGDDTARFFGNWVITFPYGGRTYTLVSVHDSGGYKNYVLLPDGSMPFGQGKFSAANGKYTAAAPKPNDSGTYQFVDKDAVTCTNAAGQTVTWKRYSAPLPPVIGTDAVYPKNINATMANALAAAHKLWMKDAAINQIELQWYPPSVLDSLKTYWLKLSMISPSIGVQCTTNVGGPINGSTICSPPTPIDRFLPPIPSTVSQDLPDVLANMRRAGLGGPLGSMALRMAGATGTEKFPAWVIEVAGGPAWVPLFVDAQDGKIMSWQRSQDPPNGSDAQLKDIWDRLLNRNQPSQGESQYQRELDYCVYALLGIGC